MPDNKITNEQFDAYEHVTYSYLLSETLINQTVLILSALQRCSSII